MRTLLRQLACHVLSALALGLVPLGAAAVPALSIHNASVTEGNSGTTTMTFVVSLSAFMSSDVTFDFFTASGSAKSGADFAPTSSSATILANDLSTTITVQIEGDTTFEENETFFVILSNMQVLGPDEATLDNAVGIGTIIDNDSPPTLSISATASVTEGNSGQSALAFVATLSEPSGRIVSVDFATSDDTAAAGADYQSVSGTLAFVPGETQKYILVNVTGDLEAEPDETFYVQLSNPTGATLATATATGTILNDDPQPVISITDTTVVEGNSGTSAATFTVSLSAPAGSTVTVDYATANVSAIAGTDYTTSSGTLTFSPGATTLTITVAVNGDLVSEPNETFVVNLTDPSANATIGTPQATATIIDNDGTPLMAISDVQVTEGNSGTANAVFTVTLSSPSASTVTVDYVTASGTATSPADFTAVSSTLSFDPLQTSKTILVPIVGDTFSEPHEFFYVQLSNASGAVIIDGSGVGTILNDDDFVLSVARSGAGSGTVASTPAAISCAPTCSATLASGTVVTLVASPAAGSSFSGWSGGCTGTGDCVVTMNADKYVTASFATSASPVRFDFNGDGRADVFWRDSAGGLNYQWQMNGLALAISGQGYMTSVPTNWTAAGRGDVNGDGLADVLWRDSGGLVYLWLVNGLGISAQGYLPSVPNPWIVSGLGDLNGDGRADVVWRNPATGQNYAWLMNGFTIASQGYLPSIAGSDWEVVAVADLSGEGRADILWRNKATGQNYLWVMNGLSITSQGYLPPVSPAAEWEVVAAPDVNGDGRADIFWRNKVNGQNYLWLMNGLAVSAQGFLPTVADVDWKVAAFGDFSGDGRGDLFWRNTTSGLNYLWMLNGLGVMGQGYLPSVSGTNWTPVK